jgi:hypothetical protein
LTAARIALDDGASTSLPDGKESRCAITILFVSRSVSST